MRVLDRQKSIILTRVGATILCSTAPIRGLHYVFGRWMVVRFRDGDLPQGRDEKYGDMGENLFGE